MGSTGVGKCSEAVFGGTNAARGAESGLVVMEIVAAERSGFCCGGEVFFRLAGSCDFFILRRFLWPSFTLIRENNSTNSSKSIMVGRLVDALAGLRYHCGAGKERFQPFGNGLSLSSGG